MVFSYSCRICVSSCVRQLTSRCVRTSATTVPRCSLLVHPSAFETLVGQRPFSTSTFVAVKPSPASSFPRRSNKSDDHSDCIEPVNAAEPVDKSDQEVKLEGSEDSNPPGSAAQSPPPSSSSGGDDSDNSEPPAPSQRPPTPSSIAKQSVPEVYPQVLALPIARRPLFPGFYKAVVIRNPAVVAAIKEMMKRGQPYLGAFLLKDDKTDSDIISDINSVHPVGVFAQITSIFASNGGSGDEKEDGLTAVLYPHRRIRITDLIKAGEQSSSAQAVPDEMQTPTSSPRVESPDAQVYQIPPGIVFHQVLLMVNSKNCRTSSDFIFAQACHFNRQRG